MVFESFDIRFLFIIPNIWSFSVSFFTVGSLSALTCFAWMKLHWLPLSIKQGTIFLHPGPSVQALTVLSSVLIIVRDL